MGNKCEGKEVDLNVQRQENECVNGKEGGWDERDWGRNRVELSVMGRRGACAGACERVCVFVCLFMCVRVCV